MAELDGMKILEAEVTYERYLQRLFKSVLVVLILENELEIVLEWAFTTAIAGVRIF